MAGTVGTVVEKTQAQTSQASSQEETQPESLIDKHSSFNGHYRSTHNLRIEGVVDGEIECESTLTIAEEARVRAKVVAQNVIVGGSLEGEVTCPGRFQILPKGRVVGKVVAGTLEILAGAFYQGELSMHPQESQAQKGDRKNGTEQASGVSLGALYAGTAPVPAAVQPSGARPPHDGKGG